MLIRLDGEHDSGQRIEGFDRHRLVVGAREERDAIRRRSLQLRQRASGRAAVVVGRETRQLAELHVLAVSAIVDRALENERHSSAGRAEARVEHVNRDTRMMFNGCCGSRSG